MTYQTRQNTDSNPPEDLEAQIQCIPPRCNSVNKRGMYQQTNRNTNHSTIMNDSETDLENSSTDIEKIQSRKPLTRFSWQMGATFLIIFIGGSYYLLNSGLDQRRRLEGEKATLSPTLEVLKAGAEERLFPGGVPASVRSIYGGLRVFPGRNETATGTEWLQTSEDGVCVKAGEDVAGASIKAGFIWKNIYFIKVVSKNSEIQSEVILGSKLRGHPNVAGLLEFFEDEEYVYLVYEYCNLGDANKFFLGKWEGRTLIPDMWEKAYPQHDRKKLFGMKFIADAAKGLSYINKQRILHRDLKPMNIYVSMVDNTFITKIGDFGAAKQLEEGKLVMKDGKSRPGTVWFFSDERADGSEYGMPSDVFSFGETMKALFPKEFSSNKKHAKDRVFSIFVRQTIIKATRDNIGVRPEAEDIPNLLRDFEDASTEDSARSRSIAYCETTEIGGGNKIIGYSGAKNVDTMVSDIPKLEDRQLDLPEQFKNVPALSQIFKR